MKDLTEDYIYIIKNYLKSCDEISSEEHISAFKNLCLDTEKLSNKMKNKNK